MASWQVQDAKARFSELLETSLSEGAFIDHLTIFAAAPCCRITLR